MRLITEHCLVIDMSVGTVIPTPLTCRLQERHALRTHAEPAFPWSTLQHNKVIDQGAGFDTSVVHTPRSMRARSATTHLGLGRGIGC